MMLDGRKLLLDTPPNSGLNRTRPQLASYSRTSVRAGYARRYVSSNFVNEKPVEMSKEDPIHSIVDRPWEYEIVTLGFYRNPINMIESFIDMTLKKDDTLIHLRFYNPQELEVEKGFPAKTSGFCIYDVSARGMENIGVRVSDFEASHGAVRFWARNVIKIGEFQRTSGET